ncbi:MAG: hypothetical protein IT242_00030 [Bacteroidia bacterium]|nr:hypothetical protein [Bacteroidia bacterium]
MISNKKTYPAAFTRLLNTVLILLASVIPCLFSFGQSATSVELRSDTTSIRIGEQIHLSLIAKSDGTSKIIFPAIPDSLHGLDVVKRSLIDTAASPDRKSFVYTQHFTVTSFDSGFYVIEPFHFAVATSHGSYDTLSTEATLISVKTVPVDTTKDIRDIKATMDVPFNWMDLIPYLIGVIALVVIVYFIVREMRKRSGIPAVPVVRLPRIPPHQAALDALRKIESEKLWQQGLVKEYHSAVTDTLRTYIERRFEIPAMESTTDEIMEHFGNNPLHENETIRLRKLLMLADMVKFAKAIPLGSENDQSMKDAIEFVMATKPVEKEELEKKGGIS